MKWVRVQRQHSQTLLRQVKADRARARELTGQVGDALQASVGSTAGLSWSFSAGALVGETLDPENRRSHRLMMGLIRRGVLSVLLGSTGE